MILGVGAGTFAVLFAIGVGVLIFFIGYCLSPQNLLPISLVSVALPLIVYGCILTAPHASLPPPLPPTYYWKDHRLQDDSPLIDKYLPVRIVILVVMVFGALGAVGGHIVTVLVEPPYTVPRTQCLREQLEEAHPTWYR